MFLLLILIEFLSFFLRSDWLLSVITLVVVLIHSVKTMRTMHSQYS